MMLMNVPEKYCESSATNTNSTHILIMSGDYGILRRLPESMVIYIHVAGTAVLVYVLFSRIGNACM